MVTKLTIEYDGTDFAGWARQPGERTVQAELEQAKLNLQYTTVKAPVAGVIGYGVGESSSRGLDDDGSSRRLCEAGAASAATSVRLRPARFAW